MCFFQVLQQAGAAFAHIPPRGVKIAGVPRVSHAAGAVGVVQQQRELALTVAAADALLKISPAVRIPSPFGSGSAAVHSAVPQLWLSP